jgi:hypothetical protein
MFRKQCLQKKNANLTLVDDNGNIWKCRVIVGTLTQANWKIGGQWKTMIDARNIIAQIIYDYGCTNTWNY